MRHSQPDQILSASGNIRKSILQANLRMKFFKNERFASREIRTLDLSLTKRAP